MLLIDQLLLEVILVAAAVVIVAGMVMPERMIVSDQTVFYCSAVHSMGY